MELKSQLTGSGPIAAKLKSVKGSKIRAVLRKCVGVGLTPLQKRLKDSAPKDTGLLRRSIGRRIKTYGDNVVGLTSARLGFRREVTVTKVVFGGNFPHASRTPYITMFRNPVFYLHFLEGGTKRLPARHLITNAMKAASGSAEAAFIAKLGPELARLVS